MRYVEAKKCEVIPIGRQGENEVETVQFDVSGWAEEYGDGVFTLLHQRSRDTAPYECPIAVDEETVSWIVRNIDTAYGGLGEAQLIYTVNEAVAKSVIFETKTYNSLDGNVVLPDPYDDWLREIHEDAEFTRENMDKVVQAEEYAEIAEEKAREASAFVGSPLSASLENEMTDHDKVYVYVGNEVGMNNGDWYYWNGTTWIDGGVYNSVAVDTDTTLSVPGKPADAKATGDKVNELSEAITIVDNNVFGDVDSTFPLTFENGTYRFTTVGSTLEKYYSGGYDLTRKVVKSTVFNAPCEVRIKAKTGYAFSVCPSENGVISRGFQRTTEFVMVAGQQYGVILRTTNGSGDISQIHVSDIIEIEYDSSFDDLPSVENVLTKNTSFDPTSSRNSAYITASNVWSIAANRHCGFSRIPDNASKVTVKGNATNNSIIAFLKTTTRTNNSTPDYATGWVDVNVMPVNSERTYSVPADANYLYYAVDFSSSVMIPQSIVYSELLKVNDGIAVYPLGLHEMPPSQRELNIVKRCRQMTDIKWTPQADLPRYMLVQRDGAGNPDTISGENYRGVFKAGVEYTGIPYGRTSQTMDDYGYSYATVGNYIDFETFISSVSNPNSKLCKEDVGSVSGHRSVIYATVCSGLGSYAMNVPEVPTAQIPSISGLNLIGKVNDNGTLLDDSKFKIGYILNKYDAHVAIITDIIRDNEGLIQFIELSDATSSGLADKNYKDGQIGGVCRRKGWTREQLFTAGSWGDYSLYSYSGTVPYTPSKYVNVGDELIMQRTEHFPCMPYEGNKFVYKTGYIPNNAIKILISPNLGYGYLKVFKDDVEITGSPFTVTNETASINVEEISTGNYRAYLCNIESGDVVAVTCSCTWSIKS